MKLNMRSGISGAGLQQGNNALPPSENHFTKQVRCRIIFEPTEMTSSPTSIYSYYSDRGEIMLYKKSTATVKQVGFLNVYYVSKLKGTNVEEGMLAIQGSGFKNTIGYIFIIVPRKLRKRFIALQF